MSNQVDQDHFSNTGYGAELVDWGTFTENQMELGILQVGWRLIVKALLR